MMISTKGRYALRFMIEVAKNGVSSYLSLKEVSENQGISIKYLEQIATQLSKSGLLLSVRGPQGGYRLIKKAEEYSVGEILRSTEGDLSPVACLSRDAGECPKQTSCSTVSFWKELDDVVNNFLDSKKLSELI